MNTTYPITALAELNAMQLPIDWEVIRLGWIGPWHYEGLVTLDDIHDVALEYLPYAEDHELDLLADLSLAEDEAIVTELLFLLAPEIGSKAYRIWRALLLHATLMVLPHTPWDAAHEIAHFWADCGDPDDAPKDFLSLDSTADEIFDLHADWLEIELAELAII